MSKYVSKFLLVLGIIVIVYIILLSITTNFNIGNLMVLFTGIFLIIHETIWHKLSKNNIIKTFKILIYSGFIFLFGMIFFIGMSSNTNPSNFKENAVIVLGSGIHGEEISLTLKKRLDKSIEYIHKNTDAVIVVSGGQGPQEDITEALAMERYLISKGIPKNKILKEDRATSTYENFVYSKKILDNQFKEPYKIAYITNNFHSYRSYKLAEISGLDAYSYNAFTDLSSALPSYMREVLAVIKLWIFKK